MNAISEPWKELYEKSAQLTKPTNAKGILLNGTIEDMKKLLVEVLRGFLNKKELHIGMKVYINNNLRNDLIEHLAANPPELNQSLEEWGELMFKKDKYGIILIGIEQYSNSFATKAAKIVRPLLEKAGMPLNGLSFLFFMGNYGFTPFGIHKEATGEDGVLFHLGPGSKQFYTWDSPKYNNIKHNTEVFHDIEEKIPEGQLYDLSPGDAMFIPHYVYHVANTPEFSSSFVLDYINPPKQEFQRSLSKLFIDEKFETREAYQNPISFNHNLSVIDDEFIGVEEIKEKLAITFKRKMLSLKSNGGIGRKSLVSRKSLPNGEEFKIKGIPVFPLYIDAVDQEYIIIFARGHRITKSKHERILEFIELLNQGREFSFLELKNLFLPDWDLTNVYGFLDELIRIEAVEVIERN